LKTDIDARGHPSKVLTECTQGASDRRGMANGPGACPGGRHVCSGGSTRPPGGQQPCGDIPMGMAAGGECCPHAGGPKAHTHRAMGAHRGCAFRATPVCLGRDEGAGATAPRTSRQGVSSREGDSVGAALRCGAAAC
jgi:hypothetical protein